MVRVVDGRTVKGRRALSIPGCCWEVAKRIEKLRLKFGEMVGITGCRILRMKEGGGPRIVIQR